MPPAKSSPAKVPPLDAKDRELCLIGATGLDDFINFVKERAIDGRQLDRGDLAQVWRQAAEVYKDLEKSEAGTGEAGRGR